MDPKSAITAIYSIAKEIYNHVKLVKANVKQCQRLVERIKVVLQSIKNLENAQNIEHYALGLNSLHQCLINCRDFIREYSNSNKLERYLLKTGTNKAKFDDLNNELQKAVQDLNLGLVAQQIINHDLDQEDYKEDRKVLLEQQEEILKKNQQLISEFQKLKLTETNHHEVLLLQIESLRKQFDRILKKIEYHSPISSLNERYQVAYYQLAFDKWIGGGRFGKVFLGRLEEKLVAIKMIDISTKTHEEIFIREVAIMSRLSSLHVVKFYGTAMEGKQACIIMEYMEQGSLYDLLQKLQFTLEQKKQIALDIIHGLHYLHSNKIWHRDLRSANVLLDAYGKAKITDFGLSKISFTGIKTTCERSNYIQCQPPEYLQSGIYTEKSDIYSFGLILLELITEKIFSANSSENKDTDKILSDKIQAIPNTVPIFYIDLIVNCTKANPEKRIDLSSIINILQSYSLLPKLITPDEHCKKGIEYEKNQQYAEAKQEYQIAAENNCPRAFTNLGVFHLKGKGGINVNKNIAYQFFLKGADGGHPRAMFNLARMLEKGDGINKDLNQALFWYKKVVSVDKNDVEAQGKCKQLEVVLHEAPVSDYRSNMNSMG